MVFVHSSDLQYTEALPFGTVASSMSEVYAARREADIAGGQSWSEDDAITAEIEKFREPIKELYGVDFNIDGVAMQAWLSGNLDALRSEAETGVSESMMTFDIGAWDNMVALLERAA